MVTIGNLQLPTLDWTALFSGVGISYLASWLLFFLLAPLFHWLLGNWKLASGVAYVVSWIAMIAVLRMYLLFVEKPNETVLHPFTM
jgi:hypothetical protein